jgi:hypothetical protein
MKDLFGTKDVQDAITASYVWMADQIGHLALGLVPTLLACWLISAFGLAEGVQAVAFAAAALLIWAYWLSKERADYRETRQRAQGVFPFDSADVLWNVKTALLYFGIGGALAAAAFVSFWLMLAALALALYPALRVAFWWLRRKLAFQQAGLPYLFRLANFGGGLDPGLMGPISLLASLKERKVCFWDVMLGRDPVPDGDPGIRHIVVAGPLGAGKTSLAVGIGTEFAFALGIGRYVTATKLMQFATAPAGPAGALEHEDGRWLWPWREADLLLIDDVDAGATRPEDFVAAMTGSSGAAPLGWLAEKRSVWVVGDVSRALAWKAAFAGLMGIGADGITAVELRSGPVRPA